MGVAHAVSGTVGGAVIVGALWLIATPLRTLAPAAIAAVAVAGLAAAAALADLGLLRLPRQRRQVPQSWARRHGLVRSYALYGFWLGAALFTNITYMVEVVVIVAAAVLLPLSEALLVGALFGLARTAPVGPLGSSLRLTRWWGDAIYGGETTLALRISVVLSAGVAVLAASRALAF